MSASDVTRILVASDRALLVEAADLEATIRLYAALEAAALPGVTELIPAAQTILVHHDPLVVSAPELAAAIRTVPPVSGEAATAGEVVIEVHYDGEDLADVAEHLGVSTEEVVARHTAAHWTVAFTGFAPGFGYISCDDPFFDVPRRSSPRTRVPAGSVALAGLFTGVYPRSSPGGWQIIGRTDEQMWDLDRDPPALLTPGVAVRFVAADPSERTGAVSEGSGDVDQRPSSSSRRPEHELEVVRPALQLLVQDTGRPGFSALGVSASGVADRGALRAANRAVGNLPGTAALELLGGGAVLRFHGDTVAALTGATAAATLTDRDGVARQVDHGVPFAVADGDELRLGSAAAGLRTVLGIRGGVEGPAALGSRATDTLAGLGPEALRAGDRVPLGDPHTAPYAVDPLPVVDHELPVSGEVVELDVVLGPRSDWFTPEALQVLESQDWLVTPRSDRVGIRLQGEVPLSRAIDGELPSEGAVTGAIQVPADGQPVLFLADHPLTGGYPIIGAVVDDHLDRAGQLPPGAKVRFRVRPSPIAMTADTSPTDV
ncbi:5-oxoprolinase/urea amidolyase family protein [Microlunatus sp. Y2014]|uniref:5-oxoprolinase subunit B/C family protein n=1 Tax=Microlunatus sp. Y2014 TaxID=3418488 RepID=UPI003DA76DE1